MRNAVIASAVLILILSLIIAFPADEGAHAEKRIRTEWEKEEFPGVHRDEGPHHLTSSAADVYCIAWYDFETLDWQGWTKYDNTAQDTFFHVDDFAGLGGGSYGGLYPLEGSKSMWCGARPDPFDLYLNTWATPPGYGNRWKQILMSDEIAVNTDVTFSYKLALDTQEHSEYLIVEVDTLLSGIWHELASYTGQIGVSAEHSFVMTIPRSIRLRFRFVSDGTGSDEDGLYDSDGAAIIDSVTVSDQSTTIDYEDFEAAAVGDKDAGIWHAETGGSYGSYSGLRNNLIDHDPCNDNYNTQVIFFEGSGNPSPSYPGLFDTPYCDMRGTVTCQNEMILSPVLDLTLYSTNCDEIQDAAIPPPDLYDLRGVNLRFTAYRDLPLDNLVFYHWKVRSIDGSDNPGLWRDRGFLYYGGEGDYLFADHTISDLMEEETEKLQIAIGIIDMYEAFSGIYGSGGWHTPAPYMDNVRLYRYKTIGPQWAWRDIDLFQDNFPNEEFNIESYVRADMAQDINPPGHPILPGDSIVVSCAAPFGGGISQNVNGKPDVYMYVLVTHLGPDAKMPPFGAILEGTYGSYVGMLGPWTIIQGEKARTGNSIEVPDLYMFDLNDSLFTRGFIVEYYFKAKDNDGYLSTLPSWAEQGRTNPYLRGYKVFEFTCLPTLSSDILYVDDFHGRGTWDGVVQNYFDDAFNAVIPGENFPDRFDIMGPSSLVSNGLESRARNNHLTTAYDKIIWDSGNLRNGTISDGSSRGDKSNDCQILLDWMALSDHKTGLLVMGDNIGWELGLLGFGPARTLLNTRCGVFPLSGFSGDSYFAMTGDTSPKLTAIAGSPFPTGGSNDYYIDGGCAIINAFDVYDTTGIGRPAFAYPTSVPPANNRLGAVFTDEIDEETNPRRTVFFGHSFMNIRATDDPATSPIVRNKILYHVIDFFENGTNLDISGDETPDAYIYSLAQNYPNPFNPVTDIRYSLREKGPVGIRIYNVAGQLVRTLVNETKEAGSYKVTWHGRNNNGSSVASGVYFYVMESKEFRSTKKMILLR